MMLLIAFLCPLACGLLLGAVNPKSRRVRAVWAVGGACLTSLLALVLALRGAGEATLLSYSRAFTLSFALDGRGRAFLCLMAFLWPLATLYAVEYMAHEERESTFFMWYSIAYGVMILFCCARNLFTLYVAYELITLSTLPLVWHKKDDDSIRAARSYICYSIGCAALGFAAFVLLSAYGSLDFAYGGGAFDAMPRKLAQFAFLAAFFGFGVKAAVFPLSAWLPKASAAPTPVTALLHAVAVVNAGVFAVLRVIYDGFGPAMLRGGWGQRAAQAAAIATVAFGAVMAVRERHVKRRLAYSTVSNLGYMLVGATLMTRAGEAAATLHMLCHSLMKIVLFYCVGAVTVQTGRTQVSQMRGLGRRMPLTFGAFLIAALALMGVPPLAGFASKYALVTAAIREGGGWALAGAAALLLSALLTAAYTLTVALPAFFLPLEGEETGRCDPGWRMLTAIFVILAAMIIVGLFPDLLMNGLRI